MLKQANNDPIPFYKQSVLIYAGINWYLDNLPIDKVLSFEKMLYQKMESSHLLLAQTIQKEEALSAQIEQEIEALIKETYEEITVV